MTPFFLRLKLAFKTFFSILFRDRIPEDAVSVFSRAPRTPGTDAAQTVEKGSVDATAAQVLAVLQRDGRLVDFLMEDVSAYSDAQIGAAVRNVHAGCRQALQSYVTLAPVLGGDEGTRVTIDGGVDPAAVKLIGNVAGQPPFTGVLRHRGWLATRIDLPALPASGNAVIAPAEVELS